MLRRFRQVDVFPSTTFSGNPVAVVLDGQGLSTEEMLRFANWTNLSETTFVTRPIAAEADYRVRIFTPVVELPFAGHPTLGTCHAWLEAGGMPASDDVIVQECEAGLIEVRSSVDGLAFAAPPVLRSGPVDEALVARIAAGAGLGRHEILGAQWVDNGPGWVAVEVADPRVLLGLRMAMIDQDVGFVAFYPPGSPHAYEVRAFFPKDDTMAEDPVTGSINASLAQWLIGAGRVTPPYVVAQGAALGRAGRVHISQDADGTIWVGGATITFVEGSVTL